MDPITFAKVSKFIGIRGLIAIGFAVGFGGALIGWNYATTKLEEERRKTAQVEARLEISNASIETLSKKLAEFVGAGAAARVAQLESIEAQAEDSADLQAQADAIREEMASLTPDEPCSCLSPRSIIKSEGL